jgi:aspartyl aminopeptidase
MKNYKELTVDLKNFLDKSPTAFQATEVIVQRLVENGYKKLLEGDKWDLRPQGKYFVVRNDSAVIAFINGGQAPAETGFKISGAHTDSPALKVKVGSETKFKGYHKVFVEVYGGPIINTWFDRELSLAGRVTYLTNGEVKSTNIYLDRPVGIIPNLAIHLNRNVNKGIEINKQTELPVMLGTSDKETYFESLIASECGVNAEDILDYDLFFIPFEKTLIYGIEDELISSGRLDDLAMCHSILTALLATNEAKSTVIATFYDNEEIGSQTLQGANSSFLEMILARINHCWAGNSEDYARAINKSFQISADQAHAVHPNYVGKHDSNYAPELNKGPVVKFSANYRYATNSESSAYFMSICKKLDIPYQKMINRSDIPSGSTIGPVSSATTSIKTVDIGNPMFAMHSTRETMGTLDQYYVTEVLKEFNKR